MDMHIPQIVFLSLLLGSFMGLEREYHKEEISGKKQAVSSLGVRTFSLLSLMGALSGFLYTTHLFISILITAGILILILANYIMGTLQTRDSGITTEIAGQIAFIIGFIHAANIFPQPITIAIAVIATLIMSRKSEIKNAVARLHGFETNAFIFYALIALVILPFLPNVAYRLQDIGAVTTLMHAYNVNLGPLAQVELINPYKLWFIIALITGIDMAGYFLNKYMGQTKGYVLSATSGGFVSSTSTTIALAQESKTSTQANKLVGAAILANTASFVQLLFLIAPINSTL